MDIIIDQMHIDVVGKLINFNTSYHLSDWYGAIHKLRNAKLPFLAPRIHV